MGVTNARRAQGNLILEGPRGFGKDELPEVIEMAQVHARKSMELFRRHLSEAQLIWIAPDLVDVVDAAASAVPPNLELALEDAPTPSGLVVLGRPLTGTDSGMDPERAGAPVRVDAISWGTAQLPPLGTDWWSRTVEFTTPSLTIASYRMLASDQHDETVEPMREHYGGDTFPPLWLPLGRSDWPYGTPLDTRHRLDMPDHQWESMAEDRRWIAALWAVLNQKRLVEVETITSDRAQTKRLARKGRPPATVVIVHLRRTVTTGTEHTDDGRRVKVRFPVKPFFRRQPYGPRAEGLRRLTLIPAHWRGPLDAPVVHTERIWSLDR